MKKLKEVKYKIGKSGAPIVLENTVGYLDAQVSETLDVGTHMMFVANVIDADIFNDDEPMTYTEYHKKKSGASTQEDPTKRPQVDQVTPVQFDKYKCTVCGYIYDPPSQRPGLRHYACQAF